MKQGQDATLELALEALEKIALHEKECGERWGEATAELRQLREMAAAHSQKWERLAWLVVTVVITGAASVLTTVLR
jgi:hypothetical protein